MSAMNGKMREKKESKKSSACQKKQDGQKGLKNNITVTAYPGGYVLTEKPRGVKVKSQ